jgi:uncharacterized RDD family membrane protein YckC
MRGDSRFFVAIMPLFCNRCGASSAEDAQFCQQCGATLLSPPPAPQAALPISPRYAGFWVRVAASLIDVFLLFSVLFPARLVMGSAVTWLGMNVQMPVREVFLVRRLVRIVIPVAVVWFYRAGLESSSNQATLGKMAMGLQVTDLHGKRISLERATGRYFAKYLSAVTLAIGYLMVAFDKRKQGLHDRIAGTLVRYRPISG